MLFTSFLILNFLFQMYDHVASAEITLVNLGKVGFEFTGVGMDPSQAKKPKAGVPIMVPHSVSHTPQYRP